ncbi:pentatricopeptide repeat-containing protein At5g04780, mitochondrial-like [Alnus glutinosa]|uniref:pentatricopeptide repeat-containing protein At5g04780, mitochondrial-like n=1 Tax=Alnus glutinosa TaxID=3517 RepID=UPI002D76EC3D|nr:pentatricopeptide repeat-containing protein At5g04780, mitochondrial-like [Alnus glutinosa]
MVNVLSACAGLGALKLGQETHLNLGRNGLGPNVFLATALVEMYSKCGKIDHACLVFVKMKEKDVPLFNAMIQGLVYHGNGKDSLAVSKQMVRFGVQPNEVTFIGILSACNHSGLVEEGRFKFSNLINKYGLSPNIIEHYACMVDLLGRAGHLHEAYKLIPPDSIIWVALLSACQIHRNLELADRIGEIIMASHDPNPGLCILLSNIYATEGRWKDVARCESMGVVEKKLMERWRLCVPWLAAEGTMAFCGSLAIAVRIASASTSKLMGTQNSVKIGAPVEIGNLMQQQCSSGSIYIKNKKRKLLGLNYVSRKVACIFFKWLDKPTCARGVEVLNKIAKKLTEVEDANGTLVARIKDLENDNISCMERVRQPLKGDDRQMEIIRCLEKENDNYRARDKFLMYALFLS